MSEEYFLKWILLESKLQYDQEKEEVKETDKRINELKYDITYFKSYLEDVKHISNNWINLDIENIEYRLRLCNTEFEYLKECRKDILENLRKSKDYGLSNKIMIK